MKGGVRGGLDCYMIRYFQPPPCLPLHKGGGCAIDFYLAARWLVEIYGLTTITTRQSLSAFVVWSIPAMIPAS